MAELESVAWWPTKGRWGLGKRVTKYSCSSNQRDTRHCNALVWTDGGEQILQKNLTHGLWCAKW